MDVLVCSEFLVSHAQRPLAEVIDRRRYGAPVDFADLDG